MNQPTSSEPPFQVAYSGLCLESARQLLIRARAAGRYAEIAQIIQGINTRLKWIPLDFGDPLRDFPDLGIQLRFGPLPPLVVTYGVDEARHIVYVVIPFKLLPNSRI
jgi:hypothetical protein